MKLPIQSQPIIRGINTFEPRHDQLRKNQAFRDLWVKLKRPFLVN